MRDAAIRMRALPQHCDLIDRAAHLLGKSRSDFILEAPCDKAQPYEHYGFKTSPAHAMTLMLRINQSLI